MRGAPLDKDETEILERIYPKIKSYLRPEGIVAIEEQGTACNRYRWRLGNATRKWWRMRFM